MKKRVLIALALLLTLSCSAVCAAADESKDVLAKYEGEQTRTQISVAEQEESTVTLPDGTHFTAEGIPENAVQWVIYSVPASEQEAWAWIMNCFKNMGTPIHVYDIYFLDADGNRINADGVAVTLVCPDCSGSYIIYALSTDGTLVRLENKTRSVSVRFVTNGSNYYVLAEEPSETDKVTVGQTTGGKVDISDPDPAVGDTVTVTPKPDDGKEVETIIVTDRNGDAIAVNDNGDGTYSYEQPEGGVTIEVTFKTVTPAAQEEVSLLWLWIALAVVVIAGGAVGVVLWRKKRAQ